MNEVLYPLAFIFGLFGLFAAILASAIAFLCMFSTKFRKEFLADISTDDRPLEIENEK